MKSVSTRLIRKHGGTWYGRIQGEIDFAVYKREQGKNFESISRANGLESTRKTVEYLEAHKRG